MKGLKSKNPLYFPIDRGIYEIAPGLRPLGHDFGNGFFDKNIFQITDDFKIYRQNMLDCRNERLSKYFVTHNLSENRLVTLTKFIIHRFIEEYPNIFSLKDGQLFCAHTGDILHFDQDFNLIQFTTTDLLLTPVTHPIDALSLQVPEDLALMCNERNEKNSFDHLALLHLCSPSHWAAEDKIGKNFFDIHSPIPGIEKINNTASKMVDTIIQKGPFVRFIWSFVTDTRLNHHPVAPENMDQVVWTGRTFNKSQATPFYFRIERQTTFGFAENQSALFTIGVSFLTGHEVKNDEHKRTQLISALLSMTPESRVYKGVAHCFDELITWLRSSD